MTLMTLPEDDGYRRVGPRLGTPSRQVSGAALAIAVAVLLFFAYTQWQNYQLAVARAERDTRNAATILSEHAARTFEGIRGTLDAVGRLRGDVVRGIYRSQASIHINLKTLHGGSPLLAEIGWFDAYGERVASSAQIDPPRTSIAQEELFLAPKESDAHHVHIAVPQFSPEDGLWQIGVSHRLEELDGSFAGVAVGMLDPEALATVYRAIDLGQGMNVTLFRRDGVVLAHVPDAAEFLGRSVRHAALFDKHLGRTMSGTYHGQSPFDGSAQIASFASINGVGDKLVICVSMPRTQVLAGFWRDLTFQSLTASLVLLLLFVGTALLVTGLRRRERLQAQLAEKTAEATAARQDAERASQAKSEFLANVSHELRTPLTLILAPLGQLLEHSQPPSDWHKHLARMQRNACLLLNRVNDTLDFSKAEAGKVDVRWELVDLTEMIPVLADDAAAVSEANKIVLTSEVDPALTAVALDRRHFEKIVLNLVSNALKVTPSGGSIQLDARVLDDSWFEFSVEDSGPGIPADKLSLLFERFQQLDSSPTRRSGGTGLGLALVKQLTVLMGGTAAVESEPGCGSRFSVRLPRRHVAHLALPAAPVGQAPRNEDVRLQQARLREARSSQQPARPTEPAARSHGGSVPRVLVADDNPDMRTYVAGLLQGECNVQTAEDGLHALEMAQREPPDLIVSDVMMPRLDGFGLVARIKASPTLAHIPVILLTARGGSEASVSGLESGADDYVAKPFAPAELRARVSAALRMSKIQMQLREKSREAGMSMVAVGVLHNLGNLLNGVTVASSVIEEHLRNSRLSQLANVARLLEEHRSELPTFLGQDERGRLLPSYIRQLSDRLEDEQSALKAELATLKDRMTHAVGVLSTQKTFTKQVAMAEFIPIDELMETALRLCKAVLEEHGVQVDRHYASSCGISVDRYKALQILLNLLENACQAMSALPDSSRQLRVRTWEADGTAWLQVEDSGIGITPERLPLLFNQGFTTKQTGHGLGLHSSANFARELGGSLTGHSDGSGKGATFTLALPARSLDEGGSRAEEVALAANS